MINLPASEIFCVDLYNRGQEIEQIEHDKAEITKLGTLRGGSSGCVTDDGDVYGTCHRKAYARYKGHQPDIEPISYFWFTNGFGNEWIWLEKLQSTVAEMGPEYTLKAETECPVAWETSNGTKVTGRPDLMIFKDDKPDLGLELKVVCAVNSAVNIFCEDKPKIENLIQTAHYSMAHGCPFNLVYSFRGRSNVPGWASKFKDKLRLSYEKVFTNPKTGRSFTKREYTIEPFIKEFRVGFDNDRVYYLKENGERVDTPLTGAGIKRYYEMIAEMDKTKSLNVRVTDLDLAGNVLPYDPCNYCPFKDACDSHENDIESWLDRVSLICEGK